MRAGGRSPVRAEVRPGQGMTEVVFRRPGRWKAVLVLVLFLAVWLVGAGFAALLMMAAHQDGALMPGLWLMIWGIVGLFFLVLLFGRAFGTEALIARADGVTLMRRLLLWSVPSEVPARSIEWIDWISDDPDIKVTVNGRRVPQPAIAIVAGKEVLRCARGIGETEADAAIAAIRQRLKLPRRPA